MRLTGPISKELREALLEVFNPPDFEIMLFDRFDIQLHNVSMASSFVRMLFEVINYFNRLNAVETLVEAAYAMFPAAPRLRKFCADHLGWNVEGDDERKPSPEDPERKWLELHQLPINPYCKDASAAAFSNGGLAYMIDPHKLVERLYQYGEISLVYGAQGTGKSDFCRALAANSWPISPGVRRVAVRFGERELIALASCLSDGRSPDQRDFIASAALAVRELVASRQLDDLPGPITPDSETRWSVLNSACTATLERSNRPTSEWISPTADRLRILLMEWLATLGFQQLVVLADEIDKAVLELGGDAATYFKLVKAIIERPAVWRGQEFCCIVFLCAECRSALESQPFFRDSVRTDSTEWEADGLIRLLSQRIHLHSEKGSEAAGFYSLLEENLRWKIDSELFELAHGRPDWALEIACQLIKIHVSESTLDLPPKQITVASWDKLKRVWQENRAERTGSLRRLRSLCEQAAAQPPVRST